MHKDGYTVFYDCLRNKTSVTSFLYCINGTMMNAKLVTSSYTIVPPSGINGKLSRTGKNSTGTEFKNYLFLTTVRRGKPAFQCTVCIIFSGSGSVPSLQLCKSALLLLLATLTEFLESITFILIHFLY